MPPGIVGVDRGVHAVARNYHADAGRQGNLVHRMIYNQFIVRFNWSSRGLRLHAADPVLGDLWGC